jgi:hypothetical protein
MPAHQRQRVRIKTLSVPSSLVTVRRTATCILNATAPHPYPSPQRGEGVL